MKERLDALVELYNTPAFVADDPVQFPRRFSALPDIETVAILISQLSWGNRKMILRDAERLLALMQGEPHAWLMSEQWREVPDERNIHRTMFGRDLKAVCFRLREIYSRYDCLHDWCKRHCPRDYPAAFLSNVLYGTSLQSQSAHKRLNMALRWLVRDDGIVDMGVWNFITPAQLFIPLDTHVMQSARALGLLSMKTPGLRAVRLLTEALRRFDPLDPVRYDFALFGYGISASEKLTLSSQLSGSSWS